MKNLMKLEDVYFAFTCIAEPTFKYNSKIEKEFKTTIILSKEQAKEFKKNKLNKTVKEIDTSEFEAKMKFPPPYPDQDEQYSIAVAKPQNYKDGNLRPAFTFPKSYFLQDGDVVEDNTILIGNGSFGNVSLDLNYNETLGQTNVALFSVLIKDLVPYVKRGSGDEWSNEGNVISAPSVPESKVSDKVVSTSELSNDDLPF